jgi:hypothetical protein
LNAGTTCVARDPVLKYKQEVTDAAICWQKYRANGFTERRGFAAFSRCSTKKVASHGLKNKSTEVTTKQTLGVVRKHYLK